MAKRRKQRGTVPDGPDAGAGRAKESAVLGFAEDLGRILGAAQSKAEDWLNQRQAISEQLAQIRDTATKYLQQITNGGADIAVAVRRGRKRGRPLGSTGKKRGPGRPPGSGKKRRTMSAAARQAISKAQKRRWAKLKKTKSAR